MLFEIIDEEYKRLLAHKDHKLVITFYDENEEIMVECEDCYECLFGVTTEEKE